MLWCLFCLFVARFMSARIGAGLPISQSLVEDTTASTVTMATEDKTLMTMANATSAVTWKQAHLVKQL